MTTTRSIGAMPCSAIAADMLGIVAHRRAGRRGPWGEASSPGRPSSRESRSGRECRAPRRPARAAWPRCRRSRRARHRAARGRRRARRGRSCRKAKSSARRTGTRSVIRRSFLISWCGGTASRFRRRAPKLRRRPPAGACGCGWPRPSIHRLSSIVSIAAAAAEIPRRRAARAQDRAHAVGGRGRPRLPGARWKRTAKAADSRIFLRPLAISWSSPRNSLPSLPSIRLRWWIRPKART